MTPATLGRSATHPTHRPRRQALARAARRASVDLLEPRQLMSLVIQLETGSGATSATVAHEGDVVTLNVVAIVTGANGNPSADGVQDVFGSFLSTELSGGSVAGTLSATLNANFTQLGSSVGTAQDLNGDNNADVGSNDDAHATGFFAAAHHGTPQTGTASGGSAIIPIGTLTYTVTHLNAGGQTNINFRPRANAIAAENASWVEDDQTADNVGTFPFVAGNPFSITTVATPTTGTVTATAYRDADGNGTKGPAETGLASANVYVDLGGTGSYATSDPSGVTAADGTVTITGVPAGTYAVREVPPLGYTQTDPAATAAARTVTVVAGGTVAAGAFGIEQDGSISGAVYVDANDNGTDDPGEAAVPTGTGVYLDVNGDGTEDAGDIETTTSSDGSFAFASVVPGTYTLRTVAPSGYVVSQPTAGSYALAVTPGQSVTGKLFGQAPVGTVTGVVYNDANDSGSQDTGEAGLTGVTVYLDANANGTPDAGELRAVTDATGAYAIADVPSGTYALREVVPTGDTQSQPAGGGSYTVTVTGGSTATASPFGIALPGSVVVTNPGATTGTITGTAYSLDPAGIQTARAGATIYLDSNGNGIMDPGETSVLTGADGTYTFADVVPGTYTLRELIPLGDALASPATGSYGPSVAAGVTVSAQDFTVQQLAASPLTVAFASNPAAAAIGGAKGVVKLRVTNPSTTAAFAAATTVSVYPSASGNVSTQDAPAGLTAVKMLRLKPGKSAVVTVKFVWPTSLTTGTYHLVAAAATGDPTVTAPALATAATTASITAASVDLAPTIVATASGVALKAGKKASVPVRLTNTGNVTADGTVTVLIYSSTTGAVDASALVIGTLAAHKVKIAAGKSAVVRVAITSPASTTVGSYTLVATVSSSTAPADADAANNTSAAVATR